MNKKGMTLVELIAVIAILGILTVMVSPAIMTIRKSVLNNTLDSKIAMIQAAALEYASERINDVPSVVDEANTATDIPCICDCTRRIEGVNEKGEPAMIVPGRYDSVGESCNSLCKSYKESDKSSDGSFKITSISGKTECASKDVNCLLVTVNQLIDRGYLIGDKDNKELLENPLCSKPLNLETVCIRYNNNDAYNRKLIAYIIGEESLRKCE